jgi:hypothetical protein
VEVLIIFSLGIFWENNFGFLLTGVNPFQPIRGLMIYSMLGWFSPTLKRKVAVLWIC